MLNTAPYLAHEIPPRVTRPLSQFKIEQSGYQLKSNYGSFTAAAVTLTHDAEDLYAADDVHHQHPLAADHVVQVLSSRVSGFFLERLCGIAVFACSFCIPW